MSVAYQTPSKEGLKNEKSIPKIFVDDFILHDCF